MLQGIFLGKSSNMIVNINIEENIIEVAASGVNEKIQFSHRWEACFLELLINRSNSELNSPLDLDTFNHAVSALGQKTPLNRMHLSRIIESIFREFNTIGHSQWVKTRLKHGQREKTVGPWRWVENKQLTRAINGTNTAKTPQNSSSTFTSVTLPRHIPKLTRECSGKAIRLMMATFLEADSLGFDGDYSQAIDVFESRDLNSASAATKSLIAIRKARWLILSGQLDAAEILLADTDLLASKMPVEQSQWVRLHARNLALRAQYVRNPVLSSANIIKELTSLKRAPSIAPDPLLAGARANLLSLAQRRRMESFKRQQDRLKAKKHYIRAIDSLSTALLCNLAANSYELVQMCCVNMAYLQQKALGMKLISSVDEVFAWYAIAFAWNNKFNLSENSTWEFIMVGELFLNENRAQERFALAATKLHWQGLRPDQAKFYRAALNSAHRQGEPDQIIHALLNAYLFEEKFGSANAAKSYASQWAEFCGAHTRQVEALKMQGYKLPKALE
jgi:tetratricopeptide (TPR) repeat protein